MAPPFSGMILFGFRRPALLIRLLLCFFAARQGFADGQDSLATRYEKGLNNDEWRAAFRYDKNLGSAAVLRILEVASSSRLRVTPDLDKWKDQQNLTMSLERRVHPNWKLLLTGDSRLFSDKQSGFANDIRTHSAGFGARYSNGWLQIPLTAGPKQDSRFGRTDAGATFSAGLEIPRLDVSGYAVGGTASWDRDELGRRQNGDADFAFGVHRSFEAGTTDSLRATVSRQRRDYYISPAGEVENRNENGQELSNVLNYRISPAMAVRMSRKRLLENSDDQRPDRRRAEPETARAPRFSRPRDRGPVLCLSLGEHGPHLFILRGGPELLAGKRPAGILLFRDVKRSGHEKPDDGRGVPDGRPVFPGGFTDAFFLPAEASVRHARSGQQRRPGRIAVLGRSAGKASVLGISRTEDDPGLLFFSSGVCFRRKKRRQQ